MPDGSNATPRVEKEYLTKSRFALALECPTKLFYADKPRYLNNKVTDEFLLALARGGFQVAALARAMHPTGECVTERTHAEQLSRTRDLLLRDEVTIFEAAIATQALFARVDILRKSGRRIELCEVKSKSYDADVHGNFLTKTGTINRDFLPLLRDLAFQRHVFTLAYPDFDVSCFLVLVDKTSYTTVDELNHASRYGGPMVISRQSRLREPMQPPPLGRRSWRRSTQMTEFQKFLLAPSRWTASTCRLPKPSGA